MPSTLSLPIRCRDVLLATTLVFASLPAAPIPPATVVHDTYLATIDAIYFSSATKVAIEFTGLPGRQYEVRRSSDLLGFVTLVNLVASSTDGSAMAVDVVRPRQFYKIGFVPNGNTVAPTWPQAAALSAADVGDTSLAIDWPAANDDQGVIAYSVYLNSQHHRILDPPATGIDLDGLSPNTLYEVDVFACDEGGNCTQLLPSLLVRTRTLQEPYLNAALASSSGSIRSAFNRSTTLAQKSSAPGSTFLHNGEFTLSRTDLAIPGRELGFTFSRTYRSDFEFQSPMGYGWLANIFEFFRERKNGDITWFQPSGRKDTFVKLPNGDYLAPPGHFVRARKTQGGGFLIIDQHGTSRLFFPGGGLRRIATRNGNQLNWSYNGPFPTAVTDEMGRATTFTYTSLGGGQRLTSVTDFTGRVVSFTYDPLGNLTSATSPAVIGNPIGNNFPNGKTEQYVYDTSNNDPDLAHNLIQVIAPNEIADGSFTPSQVITYGSAGALHDRVLTHQIGGKNSSGVPAGGTLSYSYNPHPGGSGQLVARTTITDRRGNLVHHDFNTTGNLQVKTEVLAGPNAVTTYGYSPEGLLTSIKAGESNIDQFTYDSGNPDRRQHGNLLQKKEIPANRGGDQPELITSYEYEPAFNRLRKITDPRGKKWSFAFDYQEAFDLNALGAKIDLTGAEVQALFTAAGISTIAQGDLNADGTTGQSCGNTVLQEHPVVTLLPGSYQAAAEGDPSQEIRELYAYNGFGQLTAHTDPEENVREFSYHPERDPDGDGNLDNPAGNATTGGYLKQSIADTTSAPGRNNGTNPTPTNITTLYAHNPRGALTGVINPRNVSTVYLRNQLDQVYQIRKANGFGNLNPNPPEAAPLAILNYGLDFHYDANDNLVKRDTTDNGNTANTGGVITELFTYDILNQRLTHQHEINQFQTRTTASRYDPNGNLAFVIHPIGNATAYAYEERNLRASLTRGATSPPAGALMGPNDPATTNPRGGTPSTSHFTYDRNRNLLTIEDAADTDGGAGNNGPNGGDLAETRVYDGYDRLVSKTDAAGNHDAFTYDPNGKVLRTQHFGPAGGATPTDNTPSTNLLASTTFDYDALNRLTQVNRALFLNTIPLNHQPVLLEGGPLGNLVPGDSAINTRYEYDRNSRRTFLVEDDKEVTTTTYDGAGRAVKIADHLGNSTTYAYDDRSNVIETARSEVDSAGLLPDEVFLTTHHYDALDRRILSADNIGQTERYEYDSRSNLLARTDANGPLTGATIARRAFPNGANTVNAINDPGNQTFFTYDGLNRRLIEEIVVPSEPDDGRITLITAYDANSLPVQRQDDSGNLTQYAYDNLNRLLGIEHGGQKPPALADVVKPATTRSIAYDPDHNPVTTTDEAGNVLTSTFDALNRRTQVSAAPAAGFTGTTLQFFQYDGLDRLTGAVDNNGSVLSNTFNGFAYDSLSRVVEETLTIGFGAPTLPVTYDYASSNLRTVTRYPNGRDETFSYDSLDRLVGIDGPGGPTATYRRMGPSRVLSRTNPISGLVQTNFYDGAPRLKGTELADNANTLLDYQHTYDRRANRLNQATSHNPANDESYVYDDAYRLTNVLRTGAGALLPFNSQWNLDGAGNGKFVTEPPAFHTRTHNNFNEIAAITKGGNVTNIGHNPNGQVTDDGTLLYQYDAFGRLRLVTKKNTGNLIANYGYDALGRRVRREITNLGMQNGVTHHSYSGPDVIHETDGSFALLRQFVHGPATDEPLRLDRNLDGDNVATHPTNDQALFHHHDARANVVALSDRNAKLVEGYFIEGYGAHYLYAPGGNGVVDWGGDDTIKLRNPSILDNPYLFHGRRLDPESLNYYVRHRYHHPVLHRFLTRDPLGMWADPSSHGNAYTYAGRNPINRRDPSGLFVVEIEGINAGHLTAPGTGNYTATDDLWEWGIRATPGSSYTATDDLWQVRGSAKGNYVSNSPLLDRTLANGSGGSSSLRALRERALRRIMVRGGRVGVRALNGERMGLRKNGIRMSKGRYNSGLRGIRALGWSDHNPSDPGMRAKSKMEGSFGADFSDVKIHQNSGAAPVQGLRGFRDIRDNRNGLRGIRGLRDLRDNRGRRDSRSLTGSAGGSAI